MENGELRKRGPRKIVRFFGVQRENVELKITNLKNLNNQLINNQYTNTPITNTHLTLTTLTNFNNNFLHFYKFMIKFRLQKKTKGGDSSARNRSTSGRRFRICLQKVQKTG